MSLHIALMSVAGLALLSIVIGGALGFWTIAPTATGHGRVLIRFGMAVAAVSCIATVLSSLLQGATWRERVHWELAADAGFAVLALGLLLGTLERTFHRGAARDDGHKQHAHGQSD
jgi:hypothetical protein